ncbi:MAG TPA: galactokinase [Solirubrobacteraceae bacterium]|nr:galactokinase [Solirubrobacteraceae bacterium]
MPEEVRAFAPGRVNLIGEHTDYNQGLALPFATTEGVRVSARALGEARIEVSALDLGEHDEFALDNPGPAEGWRAFVHGAVGELAGVGQQLCGASLSFTGTVPQGGGLSSSAALEVSLCLALIALAGGRVDDRIALARLCSRIENEWVGAQTGLLDQLASLCGERDHAVRIDFRSLEVEQLPLELGGHRLVTLDSGEQHSHAGSGYNQRRAECEAACRELGVSSLREASLDDARGLPEPLDRRVRHVITENRRVDETVEALHRRDLAAVGELLDASHASQRDDYDVSTPAVEEAVKALRSAGAIGARLMGGGFGGYVLGLLPPESEPPSGSVEVAPGPGAHLL